MDGDESAFDYAIWQAWHEPAAGIDGLRREPYIAAHAKRFCDHRRCQPPPPSLPRYGTRSLLRVATFVPPVPRHAYLISCPADSA
jgi:hypothetical protein